MRVVIIVSRRKAKRLAAARRREEAGWKARNGPVEVRCASDGDDASVRRAAIRDELAAELAVYPLDPDLW